jgi:glycosyltransferase involved in cell wall biosynthesis
MKYPSLVSVIIPSFNAELYILETINSVLNQSHEQVEVIVVDDGSTDKTLEIISSIADPRLIMVRQENAGACAARNLGFIKSRGDYIQFLDADDLLSPNKIQEQIDILRSAPADSISSCPWERFYEAPGDGNEESFSLLKDYDVPVQWLIDSWMWKGMAQTSVWLTPRSLIEVAGPWDETLRINQDGEFFARVLLQARSIKFSRDGMVYYRSGLSDSVSQSNNLSIEKAESLLASYRSYELNVLPLFNTDEVKTALGQNYLNFIYTFTGIHNEAVAEAWNYFRGLGHAKAWPVGGRNFVNLAKLIGFERALHLKNMIRRGC